jgi:hypothetical protein
MQYKYRLGKEISFFELELSPKNKEDIIIETLLEAGGIYYLSFKRRSAGKYYFYPYFFNANKNELIELGTGLDKVTARSFCSEHLRLNQGLHA